MLNHIKVLHVTLGVAFIFGSSLYQSIILTAFLIPVLPFDISSTEDFLNAISDGKYHMAIETTWPLYDSLKSYDDTSVGTMAQIAQSVRKYRVEDIDENLTSKEVCWEQGLFIQGGAEVVCLFEESL
jgi:hypothetical protein